MSDPPPQPTPMEQQPPRKYSTTDRNVEVAPPISTAFDVDDVFDKRTGLPNLVKLKEHLHGEGRLTHAAFLKVVRTATLILRAEPTLLEIEAPVTVCGDIHGQFYDLLRLFDVGGPPEEKQYLFLGDYVDRGYFGCETIIYLYALKITYSNRFWMIRGNHECRHLTDYFNFKQECIHKYSLEIYDEIMRSFDCLPLGGLINNKFLCIHGGLSPELETLDDLRNLNRFREPPTNGLMCDLLWSDPLPDYDTSDETTFVENTVRGCSYSYSYNVVCNFLDENNIFSLIRAHEPHDEGYCLYKKHPQTGFPTLITIFSAPNYCDSHGNKAAIIEYDANVMNIKQFTYVPHPYWLPNFMNVFSWSLPFVAEKVTELCLILLKMTEEEEEAVEIEENSADRRERIRAKIMAMSKCVHMLSTLRKENETILQLKSFIPGNKIPPGLLQSGSAAIRQTLMSFQDAAKFDKLNEMRPPLTNLQQADDEKEETFVMIPPAATPIAYEQLVMRELPIDVDLTKLESYLSEPEFSKVLGMGRADFYKMPRWKQRAAKKAAKL